MFEKGETVYYGTAGVCKVSDICRSPFDKKDDRMFYVLEPHDFDNGTIIYAPMENSQVVLRAIMPCEQASLLLESFSELEPIEVLNEKHRREEYRSALRTGTAQSIARIIKTVHIRRSAAIKAQKKVSDTDTEFDKLARKALLGELSVSLGKTYDEVEHILNAALRK